MKIVVSGASGLIGSALLPRLEADGHQVLKLVRRPAQAADEVRWNPAAGELDPAELVGVEGAVNLSGAGISSRRWTENYRKMLVDSRVSSTNLLARTLAGLAPSAKVLISGSASGFYGDTADRVTNETGPRGKGFLAGLTEAWEQATAPAEAGGLRVCHIRTGIVLSRRGGALKLQLPLFKAGLGGRLGNGRQYTSWITLDDEVAAIAFLLTAQQVSGPVNLVAPHPVTNREFTAALGEALHRPTFAAVPPFALRLVLDGFADEGLLIGQRLAPTVLTKAGFTFQHPELPGGIGVGVAFGALTRTIRHAPGTPRSSTT